MHLTYSNISDTIYMLYIIMPDSYKLYSVYRFNGVFRKQKNNVVIMQLFKKIYLIINFKGAKPKRQ